jgi:hypothetical protein
MVSGRVLARQGCFGAFKRPRGVLAIDGHDACRQRVGIGLDQGAVFGERQHQMG